VCKVSTIAYDGAIPLYTLVVCSDDADAEPDVLEDVPGEFLRRAEVKDVEIVPSIPRVAPDSAAAGDAPKSGRRKLGEHRTAPSDAEG
jgi:hypothetical protein